MSAVFISEDVDMGMVGKALVIESLRQRSVCRVLVPVRHNR